MDIDFHRLAPLGLAELVEGGLVQHARGVDEHVDLLEACGCAAQRRSIGEVNLEGLGARQRGDDLGGILRRSGDDVVVFA